MKHKLLKRIASIRLTFSKVPDFENGKVLTTTKSEFGDGGGLHNGFNGVRYPSLNWIK